MPSFTIHVKRVGGFEPPGFSSEQMHGFGTGIINEMESRISLAVNVFDQPARSLAEKYAKRKVKAGANPIRDMRLTGQTLDSLDVLEADDHHVRVGFNNNQAYKKALLSQNREPEFGLSPSNQGAVLERVEEVWAENIKERNSKS